MFSNSIRGMLPNRQSVSTFTMISRAIGLVSLVALILCIVGSTNVKSLEQLVSSQPLLTAGKIMFGVVYVAVTLITVFAIMLYYHTRSQRTQSNDEGVLLAAVVVALPLILVRLIYAYLGTWASDKARYSPFTGSLTLQITLSVWEEIAVSIVFIVVGFMVSRLPKDSSTAADVEANAVGSSGKEHWFDNKAIRYIPIIGLIARIARSRTT